MLVTPRGWNQGKSEKYLVFFAVDKGWITSYKEHMDTGWLIHPGSHPVESSYPRSKRPRHQLYEHL